MYAFRVTTLCASSSLSLSLSFLYLSLPIERILGQTISLSTGPAMKRWITGKGKGEEEEEEEREGEREEKKYRPEACGIRAMLQPLQRNRDKCIRDGY